jgi:hypothetical protein
MERLALFILPRAVDGEDNEDNEDVVDAEMASVEVVSRSTILTTASPFDRTKIDDYEDPTKVDDYEESQASF